MFLLYIVIFWLYEWIKECIDPTPLANVELVQGRVKLEILGRLEDFLLLSQSHEDLPFSTSDYAICLHEIERGQLLLVIPSCHHVYHKDCIRPVMMQRSTCPLCRRKISLEDGAGKNENEVDSAI
ncbi:hypothetical protein AQUCO_11700010v1 [Aquilegia coerulea]|uniref:RING-type domain-containing protein n=1 Tax=Aquilegia coerulea TaxID=218851 RepID=A0A2G5C2C3_AQUCA|nr:hypothetical protein AQUCO_11700010v1 [Aquilegia coerulea]